VRVGYVLRFPSRDREAIVDSRQPNPARQRHREDTALQMYGERLTAYEQRGLGEGRRRRLRLDAPLPTLPA
jgi:hypothetical protein